MTLRLRVLIALEEDLSLMPSILPSDSQPLLSPVPEDLMASSGLQTQQYSHACIPPHVRMCMCAIKDKTNL